MHNRTWETQASQDPRLPSASVAYEDYLLYIHEGGAAEGTTVGEVRRARFDSRPRGQIMSSPQVSE